MGRHPGQFLGQIKALPLGLWSDHSAVATTSGQAGARLPPDTRVSSLPHLLARSGAAGASVTWRGPTLAGCACDHVVAPSHPARSLDGVTYPCGLTDDVGLPLGCR